MRLVTNNIQRIPNNQLENKLLLDKRAAPEVYQIGLFADGVSMYYGVFIDRKTKRTYILKYKVKPSVAMLTTERGIAEEILEDDEWQTVMDLVNKYHLIEKFEIQVKKLMLQWFFSYKGNALIREDVYSGKYNEIKHKNKLPDGTPVKTYKDGKDLENKISELGSK